MDKKLSQIVGTNLKRAIALSDYKTQEEFAWEFGTDIRSVSRWVNLGLNKIDTAEEIAYFLGIETLNLFMEDVEDKKLCIIW
jgi:hypothetical protein